MKRTTPPLGRFYVVMFTLCGVGFIAAVAILLAGLAVWFWRFG